MDFYAMPSGGKKKKDKENDIGKLTRESNEFANRLKALETRTEQLSLLAEALWELAADTLKADEQALVNKVEHVKQERAERKEAKLPCEKCGMGNHASKGVCIYCGGQLKGEVRSSPFE